jgi:hypothetical protein
MPVTESYDEIKTKTIKWCQKLLDNKIYDQEKYNKCVGSFIDLGVGQLPNDMTIPEKGNEFEYGLYDHKSGATKQGVIPSDINNKIMLSTINNLYLMSDENGLLSAVASDTVYDQETLQWSLNKKSDTQYTFMSKFGKFIGSEDNGRILANRQDVSNSCIWNITAVNSYITLESLQYPDQYLTADTSIHLALNSGESQKWIITVVPKPGESLIVPYDVTPIKVKKNNKLGEVVELYKAKYQLNAEEKLVDILIDETNKTYDGIISNINENIKTINTDYNNFIKTIQNKYNKPGDTVTSLSTEERAMLANYTDDSVIINLEPDIIKKIGICGNSASPCEYEQVIIIKSAKTARITQLNSIKSNFESNMSSLNMNIDVKIKELDAMSNDLDAKLSNNKRLINNNNLELTRQAGLIDQIQRDNLALDANKKKLEIAAEQAILNKNISLAYSSSDTYYTYIYYFIIGITIVMCMFMVYNFIKKII